jgi:hypothetical protein
MRTLPLLLPALATLSACGLPPTLQSIHEETISVSCRSSSCHGGGSPQNGIDLRTVESAYASLVNVESVDAPGWIRVLPGDPERSLMYVVISNEVDDEVEDVRHMPIGFKLEDDQIEQVREWIERGAEP